MERMTDIVFATAAPVALAMQNLSLDALLLSACAPGVSTRL